MAVQNPFRIPEPPPGVVPAMAMDELAGKLAQDQYQEDLYSWFGGPGLNAWLEEGLFFLGYSILAEMAQRAEYRMFSEITAEDMTRRWIDFKGTGDHSKDDKVKQVSEAVEKFELQQVFRTAAEHDGLFGRSHIYPDLLTPDGKLRVYDVPSELQSPIGNGRDETSKAKVKKGCLKGFRVIEAYWIYPGPYNSLDPLRGDWYRPETWYVMSKSVHFSRLLTIIGRPVPDILKPAYAFGGLSMSQMAKPYVDNWLRTRQSVNDIIHSFSVFGLKTNLLASLANGGRKLIERAETFNTLRDNGNMMVLDKETEDFFNVSAPLGGLHELQSQSQEHMFSVGRIPGVKFAGIQPAGLNACLTADTLIETDAGCIAIQNVRPGHKVMTRAGWAPVAKAGCTGYATELVEIVADGAVLRCTANHRIWISSINEFVNAGSVRVGHCLLFRGATENQSTEYQSRTEATSGGIGGMATTHLRHPKNIEKNGWKRQSVETHCVVSSVRRVPASEYVYDIQVVPEYLPEFFANSICVHNSSEGEIRVWYDTIKGRQERLFRKPLKTCIDWIQLSEFGAIDEDLTFDFVNLWEPDDAAVAAVQAQKAATHAIYVNDIAAIGPDEVRKAIAEDPESPYAGLDLGDTPPPKPDPMEMMQGQGGKKAPLSNPLSERIEQQAEGAGNPASGGFPAKDSDDELEWRAEDTLAMG